MDLSLTRIDLLNTDTTSRKCLRILPLGKKNPGKTQKLVVGDHTGLVQSFGMKKGDVAHVFKASMEHAVSRIELGGTLDERDKIFVAGGQTVKAWSRKGREFLKFNTNLSEDITSMHVLNDDIYTGGEYSYNHFRSCKDAHFLMANDRINDLTAAFVNSGSQEPSPVLACQDRAVRVLGGSDIIYEGVVDGPVLTIASHSSDKVKASSAMAHFNSLDAVPPAPAPLAPQLQARASSELVYGTSNGIFGQLLLDEETMRRGWEVGGRAIAGLAQSQAGRVRRGGGVTVLCSHDLTHDGVKDILVGRDDGSVQVYSFDVSSEPKLCFESTLSGSITGLQAGLVNSANFDEIVVSTYSGQVLSFSSEPSQQIDLTGDDGGDAAPEGEDKEAVGGMQGAAGRLKGMLSRKGGGSAEATLASGAEKPMDKKAALESRVRSVRKELDELKKKVSEEQARYAKTVSQDMIAVSTDVKMRDSFALSEDEACYRLAIETGRPLDYVLLQSDVPMEVLDQTRAEAGEAHVDLTDTSEAIVSRTVSDKSNALLATYRVTDKSSRIEVRLRTIEGRYGSLNAYVIPQGQPKTAQQASYQIKPLSLHRRLQAWPEEAEARPMSELRLTGSFSLPEMHSWVFLALPEVPERLATDDATFFFKSTFLGTYLSCSYRKGDATFKSDNLTTLTTLKEVVGREATVRKVQVKTSSQVSDPSISSMLSILDPMLTYQTSLSHKVKLIETLREVEQQEGEAGFLDPAYQEILDKADTIRSEFAIMPRQLDYLVNIVIDLYVDKYKFKGSNVQSRLPMLDRMLRTDYSKQAVTQFFNEI